ncbi:GNAT family protein [Bacillus spongiae]|uniref:GNAT family protein n=1 Tax=Bacillus spongiae TaxID=2683610 RepID=A0ABU8HCI7_9BACI
MLKKRELEDCKELFDLMIHPDVFPFVRQKVYSYEEFLFLTRQVMEQEERGEIISRTILNEWGNPIGLINLFDINDHCGFLGTWLGKPYHGKGYNQPAKEAFFNELFYQLEIENIFLRIRKQNIRSNKAALKLPYVKLANTRQTSLLESINQDQGLYNIFEISRDQYTFYLARNANDMLENEPIEA